MNRGERIPLDAIMPHVQAWLDRYQGYSGVESVVRNENPYLTPEDVRKEHPEWGNDGAHENLSVLVLASASGLKPGTLGTYLRRWQAGKVNQTLGYFDVDKLLVGMGRPGLWSSDPTLRGFRDVFVYGEAGTLVGATNEGNA